jgi:hypothetical protein
VVKVCRNEYVTGERRLLTKVFPLYQLTRSSNVKREVKKVVVDQINNCGRLSGRTESYDTTEGFI